MSERTRDKLAAELRKVAAQSQPGNAEKYEAFAVRAATGEFDDYADTYDCPITQLHNELSAAGFTKFAARVAEGEFDATKEESDEWFNGPDGQAALQALANPGPVRSQIGRLALREEGHLWVAYYALTESMDGALMLGSIQLRFVDDPIRRQAFMALMMEAVGDIIEEKTGVRPQWNVPQPAPEHERQSQWDRGLDER